MSCPRQSKVLLRLISQSADKIINFHLKFSRLSLWPSTISIASLQSPAGKSQETTKPVVDTHTSPVFVSVFVLVSVSVFVSICICICICICTCICIYICICICTCICICLCICLCISISIYICLTLLACRWEKRINSVWSKWETKWSTDWDFFWKR